MLKHGEAKRGNETKEYRAWREMKARCCNPHNKAWSYYGGRGITICDEWLHDYPQFLTDMGRSPVLYSLDRKDVNGNYTPTNCRWATDQQQTANRRIKIICKNGHLINMVERDGRRRCRICKNDYQRKWQYKKQVQRG